MSDKSYLKLNIKTGEIEINGSEGFIEKQLIQVHKYMLEFFKNDLKVDTLVEAEIKEKCDVEDATSSTASKDELPDTFGEFYNKFPRTLNQSDQALVSGYFIQMKSTSKEFKTSEVNKTLKEQGIKLTNAANSLKSLCTSKKIFVNSKSGKLSLFRVSQTGEDHIISLLASDE